MTHVTTDSIYPINIQNLSFYRVHSFDAYPHLDHAIFTRNGGVSQPPFNSLNLSIAVGDSPQCVTANTMRVCQTMDTIPDKTVSCHLIHGADVLTIDKTNRQQVMGQVDSLITQDRDTYLFMRFGDCTPLIFYDPVQNAIGLTHAGWRGTVKNAAGATVEAMVKHLKCQPKNIMVVIGPAIGPCCYEVGQDVINAVTQTFDDSNSLLIHQNGRNDHAYFDMWEANQRQLETAGVEQIIQTKLCTACRTDEFFSHRAEQGRTGRFGVMIGLKKNGLPKKEPA